jgi:hypothetical protein
MGLWNRLFGRPEGAERPAEELPVTVDVLPGRLSVRVYRHDVRAGPEQVPCWTYVTDGLWEAGQKEVLFSLRRAPGEEASGPPRDPLTFFAQMHRLAEQGRRVDVGAATSFRAPSGFLGTTDLTGLAYLPAQALPGVEPPPAERALTALLLTAEEAEVVPQIGPYRLTALLGQATHYYPFPPWSERGRRSLLSRDDLEQSALSKVPLGQFPGVTALFQRPPSSDGGGLEDGASVRLRLRADSLAGAREALAALPNEWALALLTQPDPEANGRLVWRPGQQGPQAITPEGSDGSCLTGTFLAFIATPSERSGARVVEDGFVALLSASAGKQVREALLAGRPLVVPADEPGTAELRIEWLPPGAGGGAAAGGALVVNQNLLYQPEEVLQRRVASVEALGDYLNQVMAVASAYWSEVPPGAPRSVALVVAIKPGGKARFWLEAEQGGLGPELVAGLFERLRAVPPPVVREGPVAVSLQATLWGGGKAAGGWPFLPKEWVEAAGGKELLIPDGPLALVWPD